MLKKISLVTIVAALFLSACASVTTSMPMASAQPPTLTQPGAATATVQSIHLKVGILNYLSYAPLFVAQDNGYFAEQGLDVEFVNFGSTGGDMLPALLQRQLDVGASTVSSANLNAIAQGGDIKYVGDKGYANPSAACPSDAWVAAKTVLDQGALNTPSGLKGRKVVSLKSNTFEYALDLILRERGLTQADAQLVNVNDNPTRLAGLGNGALDLAPLSEPWITRARKANAGDVWQPLAQVIPNFSVGAISFGPSILEDKPDAGVRFMTAYLKAVRELSHGKTDQNVAIIAKYTKLTVDELKEVCWNSFQSDGKINVQSLMDFDQWAVDKGYLDGPLKLEQFWDPQFADKANDILNK